MVATSFTTGKRQLLKQADGLIDRHLPQPSSPDFNKPSLLTCPTCYFKGVDHKRGPRPQASAGILGGKVGVGKMLILVGVFTLLCVRPSQDVPDDSSEGTFGHFAEW